MKLVAATLCYDARPRAATVRHNAAFVDLTVLACWPFASTDGHSIARRNGDLAVLVVDIPPTTAPGMMAAAVLLANLERFFDVDGVVLLRPTERITSRSPLLLREAVAAVMPGDCGIVELADTASTIDDDAGRGRDVSRIVRPTLHEREPEEWCAALRRMAPDSPTSPSASGPDPPRPSSPGPAAWHGERRADPATGVWNPAFHRDNLYLDVPPFRFVLNRFRPASVLDIGCGLGGYVDVIGTCGVDDVIGVDGFDATADLVCPSRQYRQHDLRERLDLRRTFDLVISTEVAEHLDERYESTFIGNIARHAAATILFSAARPGQPGVGHVNCKPTEHWVERWGAEGWRVDHFATCATRSLSTYHWFRRNLLVLVPADHDDEISHRFEASPAGDIEVRRVKWFGQPPRVHNYSFEEPLPSIGLNRPESDHVDRRGE